MARTSSRKNTENVQVEATGREGTRPVWKAVISFGLVSIPVQGFTGARTEAVSFHQLCPEHRCRVKQKLVCAEHGEELERDKVVKGYEYRKNEFVTVDKQELQDITPESSSTIRIQQFVPASEIDSVYLESSYFVKPDVDSKSRKAVNADGYALLLDVLRRKNLVAIGQMTTSGREHVIAIRPFGANGLAMFKLYYADEIRRVSFDALPEVNRELAAVADQIVDAITTPFNIAAYQDGYRASLERLIDSKVQQKPLGDMPKKEPQRAEPIDLMAQLRASVEAVRAA